jgi:hypothetical protein
VLVVDEGSVGPEGASDLLACQELAGPGQEHEEHLEGLCVEFDADALSAKFAEGAVRFEYSEAETPGWLWVGHILWLSWPVYSSERQRRRFCVLGELLINLLIARVWPVRKR